MSVLFEQALKLPEAERRKLADDLYESIDTDEQEFTLTPEQKAELTWPPHRIQSTESSWRGSLGRSAGKAASASMILPIKLLDVAEIEVSKPLIGTKTKNSGLGRNFESLSKLQYRLSKNALMLFPSCVGHTFETHKFENFLLQFSSRFRLIEYWSIPFFKTAVIQWPGADVQNN